MPPSNQLCIRNCEVCGAEFWGRSGTRFDKRECMAEAFSTDLGMERCQLRVKMSSAFREYLRKVAKELGYKDTSVFVRNLLYNTLNRRRMEERIEEEIPPLMGLFQFTDPKKKTRKKKKQKVDLSTLSDVVLLELEKTIKADRSQGCVSIGKIPLYNGTNPHWPEGSCIGSVENPFGREDVNDG